MARTPAQVALYALGLGLTDVARVADVSPQYVGQVLRGERPPSAGILAAVRALGIDPVRLGWKEPDAA